MSKRVCDLMTQEVLVLDPGMTLTELDRALLERGVSGGPVVEDGVVVGVVSRADVVRALYDEQVEAGRVSGFYTSPFPIPIPALEQLANDSRKIADRIAHTRVRQVMTRDVKSIGPNDEIQVAARMMAAGGYHRIPVIEDGRVTGILSSLDIVRHVGEAGLAAG